jgi:hypothetical protein
VASHRAANREGQRMTLSWLDDLGIKDRDLQEKRVGSGNWVPAGSHPASVPSAVGDDHFQRMIRKNRGNLLFQWAEQQHFPQMCVQLPGGKVHTIVSGVAAWRATCQQCALEIVEAALAQSVTYQAERPEVAPAERELRLQLIELGQARSWERFSLKTTTPEMHGHQFTLIVGDGTEEAWSRFAFQGSYGQVCQVCEKLLAQSQLDQRIERNDLRLALARWARAYGYPQTVVEHLKLSIEAGEAGWTAFFESVSNQVLRALLKIVEPLEPPREVGEPLTVVSCGSCHKPLKFPGYTLDAVRERFQEQRCGLCLSPMFPKAKKLSEVAKERARRDLDEAIVQHRKDL